MAADPSEHAIPMGGVGMAHRDKRLRSYLVQGIQEGFQIGFSGTVQSKGAANMPSAAEKPQVIDDYPAEECSEGGVLGPLNRELFPQVHINRFGVIPKGTTGKLRLIVDMSSPSSLSVNDGIDKSLCSLSYVGISEAVRGIMERTRLAKAVIKCAYRKVPVHQEDRWLTGTLWRGSLFIDSALLGP